MPNLERTLSVNSAIYFAGILASRLLMFVTMILMSNFMGDDYFGKFSYAVTYIGFFSLVLELCSEHILIREFASERIGAPSLLGNALLLKLWVILGAMILALALDYLIFFNQEIFWIILIMTAGLPFSLKLPSLKSVFDALSKSRYKAGYPTAGELIFHLVLVGGVFCGIYYIRDREFLVWVYALGGIPGLCYLGWKTISLVRPRFEIDRRLIGYLFRQSLPLSAFTLLLSVTSRMDVLMIEYFRDFREVGLYSIVFRLSEPLTFIPAALVVSIYPLMSKLSVDSRDKLDRVYAAAIKLMLLAAIPLAVSISGFADRIIELLFSPEFMPAASVLKIYIFVIGFSFISFIANHMVVAINRQHVILYVLGAAVLLNFVLNMILIPPYGFKGAAVATVITEGGMALFYFMLTKEHLRAIKRREVMGMALIYGISAAGFFLLLPVSQIAAGALMLGVAPGFLIASGFFNRDEIKRINNVLKGTQADSNDTAGR